MLRVSVPRPGPISFILFCFLASGALRMGGDGVAIAEELSSRAEVVSEPILPIKPKPDVRSLLDEIFTRQKQLDNREIQIAKRQLILDSIEERVAVQLDILERTEQKLARTLAIADSAAENDLIGLTEVYEKMKPKSAASIFGAMEVSFAAGFLARMRPESAAGILSEMPPEAAYTISVVMAGRNANAPRE